jgi:hypothetical protein
LQVLERFIASEIENKIVHLFELYRVLNLLVQLLKLAFQLINSRYAHLVKSLLELSDCEDAHIGRLHLAANHKCDKVGLRVYPQITVEINHPFNLYVAGGSIFILVKGLLNFGGISSTCTARRWLGHIRISFREIFISSSVHIPKLKPSIKNKF